MTGAVLVFAVGGDGSCCRSATQARGNIGHLQHSFDNRIAFFPGSRRRERLFSRKDRCFLVGVVPTGIVGVVDDGVPLRGLLRQYGFIAKELPYCHGKKRLDGFASVVVTVAIHAAVDAGVETVKITVVATDAANAAVAAVPALATGVDIAKDVSDIAGVALMGGLALSKVDQLFPLAIELGRSHKARSV